MSTSEAATPTRGTMATITAAARTMHLHDALPDVVYALAGAKIADAAR